MLNWSIESAGIVAVAVAIALKIYCWSIKIPADKNQGAFPQNVCGTAMQWLVQGFKAQIWSI